MISAESVAFSYGDAPVLRDVTFAIAEHDFVVLRGESGCGKSTLLRLIARLEVPSGGRLLLHGQDYASISATTLRRRIAYLQQTPVMISGTIRENLLLSFRFTAKGATPPTDTILTEFLQRARLSSVDLDAPAEALSVGQKQRLALLRLLLMKPEVLLLDEPTAALDVDSAAVIHDWLLELRSEEGCAIVQVTHAREHALPERGSIWTLQDGTLRRESR
jgi:putative ABC transport system ATP-binding protein